MRGSRRLNVGVPVNIYALGKSRMQCDVRSGFGAGRVRAFFVSSCQ